MPLSSMTGFGSAERAWVAQGGAGALRVVVEVRSVNARFLELKVRQPFGASLEPSLRKQVERVLGRGRVELKISVEHGGGSADDAESARHGALLGLGVDPDRVREVLKAIHELEQLAAGHALTGVTALEVLNFCLSKNVDKERDISPPPWLAELVGEALAGLSGMRQTEGEALARVIAGHLDGLAQARDTLGALSDSEGERLALVVRERLDAVASQLGTSVDPERVAAEVAVLLVRGDVAEELDRIDSHLAQARGVLGADAHRGQGKTLDFLSQELLREFTTVGSKVTHHEASALVIEAKGVIERLREQVQNVE